MPIQPSRGNTTRPQTAARSIQAALHPYAQRLRLASRDGDNRGSAWEEADDSAPSLYIHGRDGGLPPRQRASSLNDTTIADLQTLVSALSFLCNSTSCHSFTSSLLIIVIPVNHHEIGHHRSAVRPGGTSSRAQRGDRQGTAAQHHVLRSVRAPRIPFHTTLLAPFFFFADNRTPDTTRRRCRRGT